MRTLFIPPSCPKTVKRSQMVKFMHWCIVKRTFTLTYSGLLLDCLSFLPQYITNLCSVYLKSQASGFREQRWSPEVQTNSLNNLSSGIRCTTATCYRCDADQLVDKVQFAPLSL